MSISPTHPYDRTPVPNTVFHCRNDDEDSISEFQPFDNNIDFADDDNDLLSVDEEFQPVTSPVPTQGIQLFTNHELACLRILDYCDSHRYPHYFFDGIMKIISKESAKGSLNFGYKLSPSRHTLT
jgi:hypothetical protein